MPMQWRFRGKLWHQPSQQWVIGEWCTWTDMYEGQSFELCCGAEWQFRKKPRRGERGWTDPRE